MNPLRTATRPSAESASDHQARVDRIVAQARADMAAGALQVTRTAVVTTGQPVALTEDPLDRRLAEEIDYARRHLDTLGDLLGNNGYLLHKHGRELQSLDKVNQLLAHVARVISASNRRQAAASITLEDLRARLMRPGLAEEPAEPMPPIAH